MDAGWFETNDSLGTRTGFSEFDMGKPSRVFNVGLDFAFLKDRLHGSFDWYVRKTKNMIGNALSFQASWAAVPVTNNTDLRTNGWELTIGWNDRLSNGLQYGISFNLSDAYATITRYPNNPSHSLGNYIEGQRIGDIYGFETIGIAKSQRDGCSYRKG